MLRSTLLLMTLAAGCTTTAVAPLDEEETSQPTAPTGTAPEVLDTGEAPEPTPEPSAACEYEELSGTWTYEDTQISTEIQLEASAELGALVGSVALGPLSDPSLCSFFLYCMSNDGAVARTRAEPIAGAPEDCLAGYYRMELQGPDSLYLEFSASGASDVEDAYTLSRAD